MINLHLRYLFIFQYFHLIYQNIQNIFFRFLFKKKRINLYIINFSFKLTFILKEIKKNSLTSALLSLGSLEQRYQ
jgi:hypothetical protein